jgi:hypothetical protein
MERFLNIYYRHVHIKADKTSRDPSKTRPEWFTHEACFRNLLTTIRSDPMGSRVRLTVVYDGQVDDFMDDFVSRYYANESLGIGVQFIRGGSDRNSGLITLAMAHQAELPPHDLVYFLENDYLHQPGWVSKVFELYDSGFKFDYVSLYDHRDKYMYAMYAELQSKIVHTKTHHWRTAPSSCGSFMFEKSVLNLDYDVLALGIPDFYFFSKLIAERGRILLTPIPGLATHCMEGYLSPTVNWQQFLY